MLYIWKENLNGFLKNLAYLFRVCIVIALDFQCIQLK